MSRRLKTGGRIIDRGRPVSFTFDGKTMRGYEGDTLASALLANGQLTMGRSFKYHRPRSVVGYGPEEPNALMQIGEGGAVRAESTGHGAAALGRPRCTQSERLALAGVRRRTDQ